jgi:glycosyltransferase involved in cell wall biosynthesis
MNINKNSESDACEPLVSITLSVHNGADTIKETIDSVIAQTYQNWELIISDNASTDDTISIAETFTDTRIRIYKNKDDKGPILNPYLLFSFAKGKYLKTIDDDSYIYPKCLEQQVEILEKFADVAFVTCDTKYRIANGKTITGKIPFKNDVVTRDEYIKYTLMTSRGSVQEGNQTLHRTENIKLAWGKYLSAGLTSGLVNIYSGNFYVPSVELKKGNLYVIRETLSAGRIEANSYSMKFNQAKLQGAWIKLLQLDGYKINPFFYIWARIMIVARSTARWFAFKLLGRN